ncbi:hypothetical protein GGF42_006177 [Coemansia sp. RSA 2424]|nr:hypothetical protein GGF42_006177 [Coemansia sp. RSA 2424]
MPPNKPPLRMYGAKGGSAVRQPLAELFVLNSSDSAEPHDSQSGADHERSAAQSSGGSGLLLMARRGGQGHLSSAEAPADSYIVELLQPSSPEENEDELGLVIQGIRRRYSAMEAEPHSGPVLHTTVADELGMLPAKKRKQSQNAQ